MLRRALVLAACALAPALASAPAAAAAPAHVPHELVVGVRAADGTVTPRVERVTDVARAARRLARRPGVAYAVPNAVARASAFIPNDAGPIGTPGSWQTTQWNFTGTDAAGRRTFGVDAPRAWEHLNAVGRPGGRGVLVAVLDTGVAYANRGRFARSPDLAGTRFARGHDFVDRDPYPNDPHGHGTHVASTIAETTNNGIGLTGLAYGARILPVRVLDRAGGGNATTIARGVRYAVRRGAKVINLSLEFDPALRARDIPQLISALSYARRRGVLVVGASGNEGERTVAYPARAATVLAVGATTLRGCISDFSNEGSGLDLVAPGGGADAAVPGDPNCQPNATANPDIFQLTLADVGTVRRFGYPQGYEGTSMATPHVSATAALVIASGVLGARPSPAQITLRLAATARDLGPRGYDRRYGAGLIDAGEATNPLNGAGRPRR